MPDSDSPTPNAATENVKVDPTRKIRIGFVTSNKMDKTVVVSVERRVQHPLYGKVVRKSKKYKAHDEQSCDIGDRVEITETRPMSRDKRWRVSKIIEKVK